MAGHRLRVGNVVGRGELPNERAENRSASTLATRIPRRSLPFTIALTEAAFGTKVGGWCATPLSRPVLDAVVAYANGVIAP